MGPFKLHEYVTWQSQCTGEMTRKSGRIIEVVPAGHKPTTMNTNSATRRRESYVVEVPKYIPSGLAVINRRKYWPRVMHLESMQAGGTRATVWA